MPSHMIRLAVTVLFGVALWQLWVGFTLGPIGFAGLAAQLGGTWLWDLRYPLIPAYAVFALWVAEKVAARVPGDLR